MEENKTIIKNDNELLEDVYLIKMATVAPPVMYQKENIDYVSYGKDNRYPDYLVDLYNNSPTHSHIVDKKTNMAFGAGLYYDKKTDTKTDKFMLCANPSETLDEVIRKCMRDFVIHNYYCLRVIWNRKHDRIIELYHIPIQYIRFGTANEKTGLIENYYYCKKWTTYNDFDSIDKYPAFSVTNKESEQMWVVRGMSQYDYYSEPTYNASMGYIECEKEFQNWNLSHIKNGFSISFMLTFIDKVAAEDPEKRRIINMKFKRKYEGTDNAGAMILNFAKDKDDAPVYQSLQPENIEKQFIKLTEDITDNVCRAHCLTSHMLIGEETPGKLGASNEYLTAWKIFKAEVTDAFRMSLLNTLKTVSAINGLQELKFKDQTPIDFFFSEATLNLILTKDELREMIGKEPLKVIEPPKAETSNIPDSTQSIDENKNADEKTDNPIKAPGFDTTKND